MTNRSKLRFDPLLMGCILIVTGFIALANLKADKPNSPVKATPSKTPLAQKAHGHIVFENTFYDFGTVMEGDIVQHTFKFKNEGTEAAKILKTETSCGCTTATGALKEYEPSETGEMEVVVDTKGKKGIIVKTVTVTLENNVVEKAELSLSMRLEPPPHPKIENIRNINTEAKCKTCHLESGEGQTGIFLYHRVCTQCHGKRGKGASATSFTDKKWLKVSDAHIKKTIRKGLPGNGMPSFVDGVTPPLEDEQVDSLIKYIRGLVQ